MAKAAKGHSRKLWVHKGGRPGDPPYGDIDAMERWKSEQGVSSGQMAMQRERMRAVSGSVVGYRLDHGGLDVMDLSGLEMTEVCPMCSSVMTTIGGDTFICGNRKCGHEVMA